MQQPLASRERKTGLVRRHWPATMGLGGAALAANLFPIVGGLFLATAVGGGVLLRRELAENCHAR